MTPEDWLRAFHFRKPGGGRGGGGVLPAAGRASYAKQLFGDAGVHRCSVGEGVMGWRNGNEGDVRVALAEGGAAAPHPAVADTRRQTSRRGGAHAQGVLLP